MMIFKFALSLAFIVASALLLFGLTQLQEAAAAEDVVATTIQVHFASAYKAKAEFIASCWFNAKVFADSKNFDESAKWGKLAHELESSDVREYKINSDVTIEKLEIR